MSRKINELTPKEVLALAICVEQANGKRLRLFAEIFQAREPETARKFLELAEEEDRHEQWLTEKFKRRFGGSIPPISEFDVEGVVEAIEWDAPEKQIAEGLKDDLVFQLALDSENRARNFYQDAVGLVEDKSLALLFRMLAAMERDHVGWLEDKIEGEDKKKAAGGKT